MKNPIPLWTGVLLTAFAGWIPSATAQFYTAPYGPNGTWNLYEVTNSTATWLAAHNVAIARKAQDTGVSGAAANPINGHLIAINSFQENSMASLIAIRHTNSSNVWIGLTDSDDPALGGAGWLDAGTSKTSAQWFWAGTTGGTGPGGTQSLGDTVHQAFFTGEPNNSTGAFAGGEDAVELRTDGRWNDNAHNVAATTRRYIIEYDLNSPGPIAGATQLSPVFTAPYGTNGTWNLYMMVAEADTWENAHNRAIALPASATGLAALAANTTTGHLLQVNSRRENSFGVAMANRLLTNNHLIAGSNALTNTWLGLTDSDDAAIGASEAGAERETAWVWAGTKNGAGPNGAQRTQDVKETTTLADDTEIVEYWANSATAGSVEPNDAGGTNYPFGEDATELRGDGRWQDLPHKIGPAGTAAVTVVRRYIIEWDLNAAAPVPGAETHGFYYTARHGAGNTWNLYYLDYTSETFRDTNDYILDPLNIQASATRIPALAGNTTPGHLVEISDAYEHGAAYRMAWFSGTWVGLTDSEDYGGEESNNASADPERQIQPFWVWSGTNSPAVYRRWNGGEPNNSNDEDAAEMTGAGVFNDLPIDSPTAAIRRAVYEWDLQSAVPVPGVEQLDPLLSGTRTLANVPAVGTWAVKTTTGVTMTNLVPALRASMDMATNGVIVEATSPVFNFNDNRVAAATSINFPGFGDVGRFAGDLPFIGDTEGVDDNHFVTFARTKISVTQAGEYTFNLHSDDTGVVRIAGQTFTAVYGTGGFIDTSGDTIFVATGSGDSNLRGVVNLAAGTYDVELLTFEGTGGSSAELSWSPGAHPTVESATANWTLVGNPAAAYPAALLPAAIGGAPPVASGLWSLHTVTGAGQLASVTQAISALGGAAGTHSTATAPVLNHSDPQAPGTGGIFPGEFTLPSNGSVDDNDFAVHATARINIVSPGLHTFAIRHSENVALRIQGQKWLNVGGDFGVDPADPSTVYTMRNSLNNTTTTEFVSRAVVDLAAGTYDVDVIAFDRDAAFFVEVYSRANNGNFINTAEYANGASVGLANFSGDYRLVGYRTDGSIGVPGVGSITTDGGGNPIGGWSRGGTNPSAAAPAGWPGTTIANHELWYANPANGTTVDPTRRETVNERDPQNPTAATGIPNDRDFWRQNNTSPATTNVDDNHYVEKFLATLEIPEAGTYSFGWQGDDGGYLEIQDLPNGVGFENRFEASAVLTPTITAATGNFANGRIQLQAGGGNTKTLARITFPGDGSITYPAQFPIQSLHFEGTGGAYWEIFAGPSNGYGRPLALLQAGQADAGVADVDGILLAEFAVGPEIRITSVSLTGGNRISFSFESIAATSYRIERTIDPAGTWESVTTVQATGASTTFAEANPTLPGTPRYFYRARQL